MAGSIAPWVLALLFQQQGDVVPRDWLAIGPLDVRGRRPFNASAAFARCLLDPGAAPPKEGEKLVGELGKEQAWTKIAADENGNVGAASGGAPWQAAFTSVDWPDEGVVLADLDGAGTVWVNGVPQVGDPYGDGMGGLPVAMKKGANAVFVTGTRGPFRLAFTEPGAPLLVNPFDATVPDLVAGAPPERMYVGLLVVNACDMSLPRVEFECGSASADDPFEPLAGGEAAPLGARGVTKLLVALVPRAGHPVFAKPGSVAAPIRVRAGSLATTTTITLEIKTAEALRRETYVSDVDASVQSFAVLPPVGGKADALVLTLHGAGVDCMGQAASYSPKPDFWIVAPTNRRRFGFDWQDWGRRDASDVIQEAVYEFAIDPSRVYVTGHSMGGHGTWHLAANDPDTFAAIAPSAGWSSFDSYGGGRPKGALAELWQGADGASRTLALIDNLKPIPTFVLHGTKDDQVPLSEAQLMLDALTKAGGAPQHHFQEGAGHWWDGNAAPGADCVDWPEIFELFRRTTRPAEAKSSSITMPAGSSGIESRGISITQTFDSGAPARVESRIEEGRVSLSTSNVRRLTLGFLMGAKPTVWSIDGETFELGSPDQAPRLAADGSGESKSAGLLKRDGHWTVDPGPNGSEKQPESSGPFKRVFDQSFALVYGTKGTPAENQALYERARYDAALWWYRANGHAEAMSDAEFVKDFVPPPNRGPSYSSFPENVLLYGNRDTNAAWSIVVGDRSPIDVRRGEITCGAQTWKRDDLGALFLRPRADGGGGGMVGVFADTGPKGSRLGYTLAPFISGVGYPDYAIFSSEILTKGDGGVVAAGWFAHDWSLQAPK